MIRPRFHSPKRVFIGIKLSEGLQDAFVHLQSVFGELPVRFIPPEDIHLTLVPPFETRDVRFTQSELHRALVHVRQFELRFRHLDWGPRRERPRLAWVECGASEELIQLKEILLRAFGMKEKVPFVPHMTVARVRRGEEKFVLRHPLTRPVRFSMKVESVELFESPRRGGTGYTVLSSALLHPLGGLPLSGTRR